MTENVGAPPRTLFEQVLEPSYVEKEWRRDRRAAFAIAAVCLALASFAFIAPVLTGSHLLETWAMAFVAAALGATFLERGMALRRAAREGATPIVLTNHGLEIRMSSRRKGRGRRYYELERIKRALWSEDHHLYIEIGPPGGSSRQSRVLVLTAASLRDPQGLITALSSLIPVDSLEPGADAYRVLGAQMPEAIL